MDRNPTLDELKTYARELGTNSSDNKGDRVLLSSETVLHCIFKNTIRMKEFENVQEIEKDSLDALIDSKDSEVNANTTVTQDRDNEEVL
jgi:hypothetical protein